MVIFTHRKIKQAYTIDKRGKKKALAFRKSYAQVIHSLGRELLKGLLLMLKCFGAKKLGRKIIIINA